MLWQGSAGVKGCLSAKTGLANPSARRLVSRLFFGNPPVATAVGSGHRCLGIAQPRTQIAMSVKIRLKRVGAKNSPAFRIVVADARSPRDGRCIEEIGTYQPLLPGHNFNLKLDRAQYWLSKGAQPSDTVASFIKKAVKLAAAAPAAPVPAAA